MILLNYGIKGIIDKGFPRDLEARNIYIPLKIIIWPRPNG